MSSPRLSRSALIAACEALAADRSEHQMFVDAASADISALRAEIDRLQSQVVNREESMLRLDSENKKLQSELAARPRGRIIRRNAARGSWCLGVVEGRLVAATADGPSSIMDGNFYATDWEEVDAP